jgi:hypothetical protein
MGKLSKFIQVYHRPLRARVPNGCGRVEVDFYEGYVVIRSHQPGVRLANEIAVTRTAWIELLTKMAKPTRLMEGPDFDRNQSEREYLATLALLEKQSKASKREHQEERHREAKRRRYLAAKTRSHRSGDATR